jgi:hypothetical protein
VQKEYRWKRKKSARVGLWKISLNRTFHLLRKADILICYPQAGRKGGKIERAVTLVMA